MPGISDSRITAGGKMSFSGTKAVTSPTMVTSEVTTQASATTGIILDLQGRLTLVEAKLVAANDEITTLTALINQLVDRIVALETEA